MAFRKRTLRNMSPVTRELARLINELDSIERRAKNLLEKVRRNELDAKALDKMMAEGEMSQPAEETRGDKSPRKNSLDKLFD